MLYHWLFDDLRGTVPSPWLQIVLALGAVICGAIVGADRERQEKSAGLRTLILVCLGSAGFTMASFAFTTTNGDSGRVAAQIVAGIGFLGAGAILHGPGIVKGMTTAATIWAMAATGMIVGIGYVGAGLGLSLLVRLVLSGIIAVEQRAMGAAQPSVVEVVFAVNGGKTRIRIEKIMEDFHIGAPLKISETRADGTVRATLPCHLSRLHHREFLNELARLPEVLELNELEQK